jgi:methionyl-tRNA formyltransferase
MRLVFIGAVEGSYRALQTLLSSAAPIVRVVTLDNKFADRHSDFCNLQTLAQDYNVPVTLVDNVNAAHVLETLQSDEPDYVLVIGWSQLLKDQLLQLPKVGTIGFHPALLPKHRGRAAVPWAIINRLQESGVTLFHIDDGVDSGDIVYQYRFELEPDETATTLYAKVSDHLVLLMRDLAQDLASGQPLPRRRQDESQATYTSKRTKQDGLIDWTKPAEEVWTLIRATTRPYPGAFTFYRERPLTIWSADLIELSNHIAMPGQVATLEPRGPIVQCGTGQIQLREVQPEQRSSLPATEYFTKPHEVLGIDWLRVYEQWRQYRMKESS